VHEILPWALFMWSWRLASLQGRSHTLQMPDIREDKGGGERCLKCKGFIVGWVYVKDWGGGRDGKQ
jgi:hypothetical protein